MIKLLLLPLIVLLHACAFKSAAVGQLDTFIEYQTGSRLDLYLHQKQQLEKDVNTLLTEQQKSLSDVKELLNSIDLKQEDELKTQWAKLTQLYHRVALAYAQVFSTHLAALDGAQQKTFFAKMKEENQEIKERNSERSVDKLSERVEYFLGSINDKQREVLKVHLPAINLRAKARLKRRETLHKTFKSIFDQKLTNELKRTQIYQAFVTYQDDTLKSQDSFFAVIKDIAIHSNEEQKKTFLEKKQEVLELVNLFEKAEY
ncbi:MAG: hypothetical protein ACLGG0_01330 [Bacteriovoracia bacterium]